MKKIIRFFLNIIPRKYLIRLSYVVRFFTSVYYKGNKYHCPVCEKKFRKLLPYGYRIVRENVLCPNCLSLERHRLLWLYLKERTNFFTANLKMMHVAPEQCFLERFKKMDNLDYTTVDMESPIADVKADIQKLPFDDEIFDVVMCNHVLEHVEDLYRAVSEIMRVLKFGGYAILQVPIEMDREETYEDLSVTNPREREKIFGQYDHVRVFGRDYPKILEKAGFIVKEKNYLDDISDETIDMYRLTRNDMMVSFRKENQV